MNTAAKLRIVAHVYRDQKGYSIYGTDTRGRRVLVFAAGPRKGAETAKRRIAAGLTAFGDDKEARLVWV